MSELIKAKAINAYTDRITRANIQRGQIVYLSEQRFEELSAKRKVDFADEDPKPAAEQAPFYANAEGHKPPLGTPPSEQDNKQIPGKSLF